MSDIKVSIIIPIYNAEQYLEECLNSVVNQTLKEIEIICINDCSTDSSLKILEEYAKKDNRIKIFHTEKSSGGPATGRNMGIEKSSGEYIAFIDSDDYIDQRFYEELYKTAKKYNADIINNLNIIEYYENGKYKNCFCHINNYDKKAKLEYKIIFNKNAIMEHNKFFLGWVIWNKLYKKSFIIDNNMKFIIAPSGYEDGSEDWAFNIELITKKPIAVCNHKFPYFYRIRNDSLSRNYISILPICYRAETIINNKLQCVDEEYKKIIISKMVEHINSIFNDIKCRNETNYYHIYNLLKNIDDKNIDKLSNYTYYDCMLIKKYQKYSDYQIASDTMKLFYKKLEKIVNKIVWLIPIKKYRDIIRTKIIREINYEK
ncbi:glycosyltransferase family 2 protein [Brachyspira pulli]|uniref:glycosyltransferase family 2 protein n=1 Tax=Brachyspira pulli TaxID=310721 RepID=UPI003005596C